MAVLNGKVLKRKISSNAFSFKMKEFYRKELARKKI